MLNFVDLFCSSLLFLTVLWLGSVLVRAVWRLSRAAFAALVTLFVLLTAAALLNDKAYVQSKQLPDALTNNVFWQAMTRQVSQPSDTPSKLQATSDNANATQAHNLAFANSRSQRVSTCVALRRSLMWARSSTPSTAASSSPRASGSTTRRAHGTALNCESRNRNDGRNDNDVSNGNDGNWWTSAQFSVARALR